KSRRQSGDARIKAAAIQQFREDVMAECAEQMLFNDLVAARRAAEASEDPAAWRYAGRMYQRYMRSHLTDPERELLRLEDEVARLSAENRLLKERRCD